MAIVASSVLFVSIIKGTTMTIVACSVLLSVSLRHKGYNTHDDCSLQCYVVCLSP